MTTTNGLAVAGHASRVVPAITKAAELAVRVPILRDYLLRGLFRALGRAYDVTVDNPATLLNDRWLASSLQPFVERLVRERPASARAIVRFIGTWVGDMYRRTDMQQAGAVTPITIVIEPTDRCNLHCPGCYAKSSCDGSDLPYDRMVQIVEEAIGMGATLITISGGEPFLRERLDRTLTRLGARFRDRGFLIYTNGTLIDEDIAKRVGKVGNLFPAISVEGFEHQTDARRGRGTYRQNRQVRRLLARHGVMAGFSATVTRKNADSICADAFIDLRIEEGDLFGWFFLLQPIGRSPRPDLMVTAEQRAMLRETIYRWRDERRPIFLGDFWNDGPLVGGCIAGGHYYLHIYANGDISPCVFSPVACGNVFDIIEGRSEYASLSEFMQRHPVFRAFRQEQARITDRKRPCLLIDHPEAFRRICRAGGCLPAKNMPEGYLDGPIARHIDRVADEWRRKAEHLPPLLPGERLVAAPRGSNADVVGLAGVPGK